jgi:hypothetical protein
MSVRVWRECAYQGRVICEIGSVICVLYGLCACVWSLVLLPSDDLRYLYIDLVILVYLVNSGEKIMCYWWRSWCPPLAMVPCAISGEVGLRLFYRDNY